MQKPCILVVSSGIYNRVFKIVRHYSQKSIWDIFRRAKPPQKIFLWYKLFKSLLVSPILLAKAYMKDSCTEQDSAHMATIVQLLLIPKFLYLPQKHCFSQSPLANVFQLNMSVIALHKTWSPASFFIQNLFWQSSPQVKQRHHHSGQKLHSLTQ